MSNTPLTDARAHQLQADGLVDAEFAGQLEQENAMLREALRRVAETADQQSKLTDGYVLVRANQIQPVD